MKLVVVTPLAIVTSGDQVTYLRAEDASGSFGIMPRHASLVTALSISVVSWRDAQGEELHCAVRGGMLSVEGDTVSIATREAVIDRDLDGSKGRSWPGSGGRRRVGPRPRRRGTPPRATIRHIHRLLRPQTPRRPGRSYP